MPTEVYTPVKLKPFLNRVSTLQSRLKVDKPQSSTRCLRLTGRALQKRNARVLQRYPLCAICEARGLVAPSTQVDHRWPLIDGGDDSDSNCWGLCDVCHQDKTSEEARRRALGLTDVLPGLPPMKAPRALVMA